MAERRLRAVPPSPAKAGRSPARVRKQPQPKPLGPPPEVLRAAEESAGRVRLGGIYAPISASRAEAAGALISPEAPSPKPVLPPPKPVSKHRRLRRILELRFWPMTNLRRRWRLMIAFATLFFVFVGSVYFGPVRLNPPAQLQTAVLTDYWGEPLGEIRPEQNRVVLDLCTAKRTENCIPKIVQQAFVAIEDERFWSHLGVDPIAIVRAIGANARGDREGASTITQQYVKNTFTGSRRTLWRKLREAILAVRVDRKFSKEAILEAYLNSIYLGNGAYGVEAAARLYFGTLKKPDPNAGKPRVASITAGQAAMLAGITANPSRWDPRGSTARKQASQARRDFVLSRMHTLGMISASDMAAAQAEEFKIQSAPRGKKAEAPGFQDWLKGQLQDILGPDKLYTSGLKVKTSLDLEMQRFAEDSVAKVLNREGDPEAAVVTIDVATGGVRVMYGGRNKRLGDFNLATQARRQAGSAFKPFVLAAALEQGKTLGSTYRAPGSIRLKIPGGGVWKVSNFDRRGRGRLSLRAATAGSVNTVFAQLILDVGPEEVVAVAKDAGITSRLTAVPSLALGTSGVSALEMAGAFATFAREGQRLFPTGVSEARNRQGDLLAGERTGKELITPEAAFDVWDALTTVVRSGTGRPARIPGYTTWGKTGTTEDHADAWFVGGAGGFVTAVWVGYPSGRKPMTNVHGIEVVGSSFPAQIWKRVMTKILDKYKSEDVAFPKDPVTNKPKTAQPLPSEEPTEEPSESAEPTPTPTQSCILGVLCR
jgi:penicillin-binding protein 1A